VRGQRARIGAVAQQDQGGELVEEAGRLDGGRDQDEEGVQQREPGPVEQLVGLVQGPGNPCQPTRRTTPNGIHQRPPQLKLLQHIE